MNSKSYDPRVLSAEGKPWWSYWPRNIAFILVHVACLFAFVVGVSPVAVIVAVLSYVARGFGLTAGFHRYFCHRAYTVGRPMQFVLAFLGTAAAQRGPLWWAAHHMRHHRHPDAEGDVHSPVCRGFWWAHVGWTFVPENAATNMEAMKGWAKYPELRFLNRYYQLAPLVWAAGCYALGWWLGGSFPQLGTSGPQMLIWGFFIPTVVLYHATFCVNSVCHTWGLRRYETDDQSRNNPLVALATLGEGWHNNHHRYPISARQGVGIWEFDPTYWTLRGLAVLGLVRNIRERPDSTA